MKQTWRQGEVAAAWTREVAGRLERRSRAQLVPCHPLQSSLRTASHPFRPCTQDPFRLHFWASASRDMQLRGNTLSPCTSWTSLASCKGKGVFIAQWLLIIFISFQLFLCFLSLINQLSPHTIRYLVWGDSLIMNFIYLHLEKTTENKSGLKTI